VRWRKRVPGENLIMTIEGLENVRCDERLMRSVFGEVEGCEASLGMRAFCGDKFEVEVYC
jgi:hypothetical protein